MKAAENVLFTIGMMFLVVLTVLALFSTGCEAVITQTGIRAPIASDIEMFNKIDVPYCGEFDPDYFPDWALRQMARDGECEWDLTEQSVIACSDLADPMEVSEDSIDRLFLAGYCWTDTVTSEDVRHSLHS
jgi:hypothetical protein